MNKLKVNTSIERNNKNIFIGDAAYDSNNTINKLMTLIYDFQSFH